MKFNIFGKNWCEFRLAVKPVELSKCLKTVRFLESKFDTLPTLPRRQVGLKMNEFISLRKYV